MNEAADVFEKLREHLFGIAYRMVGTVAEAEDLVQEAWVRWSRVEEKAEIRSPRAYLTTVVTRLAVSHLRSVSVRREEYVGPWLPEPLATDPSPSPARRVELEESITLAFLTLLQSLDPRQRAVFVLHEAFGVPHGRIASILDVTEVHSRKILGRARAELRARRPRFEPSPEELKALIARFREAARSGDLEALTALLAEEVVAVTDGGGRARAALKPLHGRDRVGRFVVGSVRKFVPPGSVTTLVHVNRAPGILVSDGDRPLAVITADVRDGLIQTLYVVTNPDKLGGVWRREREWEREE